MVAVAFTIALCVVIAGVFWLVFGARLRMAPDASTNDVLNLICYFLLALPVVFVFVFFAIERL